MFRLTSCLRGTAVFLLAFGMMSPAYSDINGTVTIVNRGSVANGASADVYASCPSGMAALSGGVDLENVLTMRVTTLAPTYSGTIMFNKPDGNNGAPDGWYASARNDSGGTRLVVVGVVCAPVTGVVSVLNTTTIAAGGFGGNNITCPSGTVATGGGVDNQYPLQMIVTSDSPRFEGSSFRTLEQPVGTGPAPNGWYGTAHNIGGSAGMMRLGAVCAPLTGISTVIAAANVSPGNFESANPVCPSGQIAVGGGVDLYNVLTMSVTSLEMKFGSDPSFLWERSNGENPAPVSWLGFARNDDSTSKQIKAASICALRPLPPPVAIADVIEFYNTTLGHYFMTASTSEADYVRGGGAGAGWVETGYRFRACLGSCSGSNVCRFYNPGANTHFYTADPGECSYIQSHDPGWHYENVAFNIPVPSASGCPSGHVPIYRLYNNRYMFNDSNHRFTPSLSVYNSMIASGWAGEGVRMCGLP